MCLVSCLLYSVGVLKYEVELSLKHEGVFDKPVDHDRLRECIKKFETLAERIVHKLYEKDNILPTRLFESRIDSIKTDVIDLAFMVQAKPFISDPACTEFLY